jgi:hypothetical protein
LRRRLFAIDNQDQPLSRLLTDGSVTLDTRAALRPYARNNNVTSVRTLRRRLFELDNQDSVPTVDVMRSITR